MKTPVHIVNIALARLDRDPMTSMSEPADMARKVRPVWQLVLETFLTEHEWSFAKKEDVPARLVLPDSDNPSYRYAFALPQDCLKMRKVTRSGEKYRLFGQTRPARPGVGYEVMRYGDDRKQAIFTDAQEIAIEYTSSAAILDDFSPDALDALAFKVAYELSLNVSGATARAQEMIQRHQMALTAAIKNDAKTRETPRINGHDYSDARRI